MVAAPAAVRTLLTTAPFSHTPIADDSPFLARALLLTQFTMGKSPILNIDKNIAASNRPF
jgi:hypothetical protein